MENKNIDFKFIFELEGVSLEGYVPDPKNSNSGVTISNGFDLGQRNKKDMEIFPEIIANKLLPYVGKIKEKAEDFLLSHPLEISEEEALIINEIVKNQEINKLKKYWNESNPYCDFDKLPKECATVVASVAFQYGTHLGKRTPKFWKQATNGKWDEVISNLRNFGDNYTSRRNREANYLKDSIGK